MDNNIKGGWARSPSTLVQLAISSVPPVDPKFFDVIDGVIDKTAPVPSNQLIPGVMEKIGNTLESFLTGGNEEKREDKYYKKYLKYKAKYLKLKEELDKLKAKQKGGCSSCSMVGGCNCGVL